MILSKVSSVNEDKTNQSGNMEICRNTCVLLADRSLSVIEVTMLKSKLGQCEEKMDILRFFFSRKENKSCSSSTSSQSEPGKHSV